MVLLILSPTDIALMIVAQQHAPLIPWLAHPCGLASAAIDDPRSLRASSEGIGTRVEWIVKDLHDAVIGRRFPNKFADVDIAQDDRHLDIGRPQPQKNLSSTSQFPEFGKNEPDRFGHMFVRIDLDLTHLAPTQARRQHEPQFPTSCLGITRGDAALAHQTKLILRHRAFQSKQQAIVDQPGIISAIRIDDQCTGECAKVDQMMPVSAIARQTRCLDAIDRSHIAGADLCHKPFESGPFHAT